MFRGMHFQKQANYNFNIARSFGNLRPFSSHGWEIVLFCYIICNVLAKWCMAPPSPPPPYPINGSTPKQLPKPISISHLNPATKLHFLIQPIDTTCWYLLIALNIPPISIPTNIYSDPNSFMNTQYLYLNQAYSPCAHTKKHGNIQPFNFYGIILK